MLFNEECPGWLYPVNNGATTIWERWNGIYSNGELFEPNMNSYNQYAYGAVAHWMHEKILGIRILENGFSRISISPNLTDTSKMPKVVLILSVDLLLSTDMSKTVVGFIPKPQHM